MTEQIQTHPTDFKVEKHFGPFFASCMLPQDAVDAMLKMSDEILSDKLSESHGQSLAGVIDKEVKVYKPPSSRKDSKESFIICKKIR